MGWGGVGCGGACSNVHVNFALIRHARATGSSLELCTHTSC